MATAKKIPDSNYQVQFTLSPVEARYLFVVLGRVAGIRPVNEIWEPMCNVFPSAPSVVGQVTFNYGLLSENIRDWVENGE